MSCRWSDAAARPFPPAPLTLRLSKGERSEGAAIPFALSLSKGFAPLRSWFEGLTMSGKNRIRHFNHPSPPRPAGLPSKGACRSMGGGIT